MREAKMSHLRAIEVSHAYIFQCNYSILSRVIIKALGCYHIGQNNGMITKKCDQVTLFAGL